MIRWVKPKISQKYLGGALLLAFLGLYLAQNTTSVGPYPAFSEQIAAAELMQKALEVLKEARLELALPLNREDDPNETGLIGLTFTTITTSSGNLEAKRTSTNPAFAALMVRLFREAGLKKGAAVAIGASGSFPGLIVATLAACDVLGLKPLLFYSLGSSMYGANLPQFTFLAMSEVLRNRGVFPAEILAVSLGGDQDRGEGLFFPEAQELMLEMARSFGAVLILEENVAASIQKRRALYSQFNGGRLPDCFVNIGGASPNYGRTAASLKFPNGLVTGRALSAKDPERGLIFDYLEEGVPVIHLLNIRDLALKSGITLDPVPFPPLGSEGVFFYTQRRTWLIWLCLGLPFSLLIGGKKWGKQIH